MRFPLLAAVMAVLVLEGCSPEPVGPRSGETARLRLASASPDAGTLDLLVNGRTVAQAVGRTEVSPAAVLEPGSATGEVRATGSAAALASLPLALEAGKSYTVLVAGPVGALTAMVSVDTGSAGSPPPPPSTQPPVDSGGPPRRTRRRSIPISSPWARRWTRCRPCSPSHTAVWRSQPTSSGARGTGRSSSPSRAVPAWCCRRVT
jgi:uncharacterized protein DUF4397